MDLQAFPKPEVRCARSVAAIAAAYAQEKRNASLVRRRLLERIDGLLPTELILRFEYDLTDLTGGAAHRASRRCASEAQHVARGAMLAAVSQVARALEGFETRLCARSAIALHGGDVVQLDQERCANLLGEFSDELAEILIISLPRMASLANPVLAKTIMVEAKAKLHWVREKWEAVLLCKTQITDLFNDNDWWSSQQKQNLLVEALDLMEVGRPPPLRVSDTAEVSRFLIDAILQCPRDDVLRERVASILASFILPKGVNGPDHTWVRVATRVLHVLADHAQEEAAVVRLQAFCRGCNTRRALWRRRSANAHAVFPPRTYALVATADPILLAQSLLRQAISLAASLARPPAASALAQLQRGCTVLGKLELDSLMDDKDRFWSFWLNTRSLGVLLAVLLASPLSAPRPSFSRASGGGSGTMKPFGASNGSNGANHSGPLRCAAVGPEIWADALCAGSLLIGGALLTPNQIDHYILRLGFSAPLPAPARKCSWLNDDKQSSRLSLECSLQNDMHWVAFGLWLPVRFGLPPLRVYRPEVISAQLRLNAQTFVAECSEVALLSGCSPNTVAVPPLLHALNLTEWQPLLGVPSEIETIACDVDWAFDPRRLVATGADDAVLCTS